MVAEPIARADRRLTLFGMIVYLGLAGLVVGYVGSGGQFFAVGASSGRNAIPVAERLKSLGVVHDQQPMLVLALSIDCPHCVRSLPFYGELMTFSGDRVRTVALFPSDERNVEEHLVAHGVHVSDVRQVNLRELGITGFPTLLFADAHGTERLWVGKLSPAMESEVMNALRSRHGE